MAWAVRGPNYFNATVNVCSTNVEGSGASVRAISVSHGGRRSHGLNNHSRRTLHELHQAHRIGTLPFIGSRCVCEVYPFCEALGCVPCVLAVTQTHIHIHATLNVNVFLRALHMLRFQPHRLP